MSARAPQPRISVVIPAYQAAQDIGAALASVFAQTCAASEVIVVNDGSPDTPALERAIAPFRSQLCYIVQENRGAASARNTAIRAATGQWLAFLDADDLWDPRFLEQQMALLASRPGTALVYADAIITGESDLAGRRFMDTAPSGGDVTLRSLIEQRCNIPLSTVVADREIVVRSGLFDEALRRGQDFDLWLRLAREGHAMAYQRRVLAVRRVRRAGLSGSPAAELKRAIAVLDRFGRQHDLPVAERTALRVRLMALNGCLDLELAKARLVDGDFAAARRHLHASSSASLRVWAARAALIVAPQLLRRCYVALRKPQPAGAIRPLPAP